MLATSAIDFLVMIVVGLAIVLLPVCVRPRWFGLRESLLLALLPIGGFQECRAQTVSESPAVHVSWAGPLHAASARDAGRICTPDGCTAVPLHRPTADGHVIHSGSGVVVGPLDRDYALVSAAHVFREYAPGAPGYSAIWVTTSAQRRYHATLVYTDPDNDIAILRVRGPATFIMAPLAPEYPRPQEIVRIEGYPASKFRRLTVSVLGYLQGTSRTVYSAGLGVGVSGGPVLNNRGEVVGLQNFIDHPAAGNVRSYGPTVSPIRTCLIRAFGRWPYNVVVVNPPAPVPQPAPQPEIPPAPVPQPAPQPHPQPLPEPSSPPTSTPVPLAIRLQLQAMSEDNTEFLAIVFADTKEPVRVKTIDAQGRESERLFRTGEPIPLRFTPRQVPITP